MDERATLSALRATVARQEQIIAALVEAAERRTDSATRLGEQYVIERRAAKAHQAERVLRSVIEALDGALCIIGADGTVLDANTQWLRRNTGLLQEVTNCRPIKSSTAGKTS